MRVVIDGSEFDEQGKGVIHSTGMNKYRVSPAELRTINGIRFDSKAEMRRWQELNLLEAAGQIKELERQPVYVLADAFTDNEGKKQRAIKYIGDFRYTEGGRVVVEDVKGFWTQTARLKVKLFRQKFPGIIFKEVK
jgi:hypothetical protein